MKPIKELQYCDSKVLAMTEMMASHTFPTGDDGGSMFLRKKKCLNFYRTDLMQLVPSFRLLPLNSEGALLYFSV